MLASVGRVAAQRLAPRRIAASSSSSGYIVRVGRLAALQPHGSSALLGAAFTKRTYAAAAAAAAGRPKKTAAGKTATATKDKAKPRKTAAAAAAPTKKAAPKKKTVKAKTAASKTKKQPVVRRPRKVLSVEEKAEQKSTAQKKLWKEKAMLGAEPKPLPASAWLVFTQESFADHFEGGGRIGESMNKISETFKALPSAELQRLEGIAEQNRVENAARYKAWVVSHTPLEIYEAIRARKLLKLKFNLPKARKNWERIQDDRQPKRPCTSYFYFARARIAAGDGGNGRITERQKNIADIWKTMGSAERQPYIDLSEADRVRFAREAEAAGLRTHTTITA